MSCCSAAGIRCQLPRTARPDGPTVAQQTRRRNALWLFAVTIGLHDPATGRVRPHSTEELSLLCNVSARTVQLGIASARRLREIADGA